MPRIRHHVNPLHARFQELCAARPVLATGAEIEVELGCADARFLFERAAAHPEVECVGLEIREDLVDEVNARAAGLGLPNLRAIFCNANVDFETLFDDGSLARVFVNFPDPWFKRRHHKRRVVTDELARVLYRKLAPDGVLFFQSDIYDLALDAMAVIEGCGLYENRLGEWSFARENPFGARSLREVYCEEEGGRAWRMLYEKAAPRGGGQGDESASHRSGRETS